MTRESAYIAWRIGWNTIGRILARNLAQADNKLYYKIWFSWRMPAFWITALLFCLPLGILCKFLADRNHIFTSLVFHLINFIAILPFGAYFGLKWWIEKNNSPPKKVQSTCHKVSGPLTRAVGDTR